MAFEDSRDKVKSVSRNAEKFKGNWESNFRPKAAAGFAGKKDQSKRLPANRAPSKLIHIDLMAPTEKRGLASEKIEINALARSGQDGPRVSLKARQSAKS